MCKYTSTTTNGRFIQDNGASLEAHLQAAKQSLLLDADAEVDGCVNDVLTGIFKPEEIRVERYKGVLKRNLLLMEDKEWWSSLKKDMEAGLKVGVPCRTKKDTKKIAHMATKFNVKTKIYNS